jgi:hypothetical protein
MTLADDVPDGESEKSNRAQPSASARVLAKNSPSRSIAMTDPASDASKRIESASPDHDHSRSGEVGGDGDGARARRNERIARA